MRKLFIVVSVHFLILCTLCVPRISFSQGYVCAIGGGSEGYNTWSDRPYSWIVEKADSGKVIILSYTTGASEWLPNYFLSLGASVAYNKTIDSRNEAELDATYEELITADAIFLRGGNQWNYVRLWRGTKTEQAILDLFKNGGVIAGTSAGAAVLGEIVFSARRGSAFPRESLQNPFYNRMTLEDDFLNLVPDVLFDSHFTERGRFGRLIPMLYNIFQTSGRHIIGVGIDDRTAICIEPNGYGTVMGSGSVAIYRADEQTRYELHPDGYVINRLLSDYLTEDWIFNFHTQKMQATSSFSRPYIHEDSVVSPPLTNFYLTGYQSDQQTTEELLDKVILSSQQSFLIIAQGEFENDMQALTSYISSKGIPVAHHFLSTGSANDTNLAARIEDATDIVIFSDDLSLVRPLGEMNTATGAAMMKFIDSKDNALIFLGNAGKVAGGKYIDNTDNHEYAAYRGQMTNHPGWGLLHDLIFQPLIFEESTYFENRSSSVLWGMMINNKRLGVYADNAAVLNLSDDNGLISFHNSSPVIFIDARETTLADSSRYVMPNATRTRQSVALNNLRFSVTTTNRVTYSQSTGDFNPISSVQSTEDISNKYSLAANFPNPFNPQTTILFEIPEKMDIRMDIFNTTGQRIATLFDGLLPSGSHSIVFDTSLTRGGLASGVYIVKLSSKAGILTHKIVLIK